MVGAWVACPFVFVLFNARIGDHGLFFSFYSPAAHVEKKKNAAHYLRQIGHFLFYFASSTLLWCW